MTKLPALIRWECGKGTSEFAFFLQKRPLRGRNIGLLDQFYAILSTVHMDKDGEDRLIWKDNNS